MHDNVEISFVIPTFDESEHIAPTLGRINSLLAGRCRYETIVVDNGSRDGTADIARLAGARVFVKPGVTIGALRNHGAANAKGAILIFLDADVHITERWVNHLPARLEVFSNEPRILMGSLCGVPADASWIERSWFDPMQRRHRVTHIGSGHLLTTKSFFTELHGFEERLRTGEDYDLSQRALAAEGRLVDAPELVVEHLGYPSTVRQFVKREMWHGEGDFGSIPALLHSKVALLTVGFIALHIGLLVSVANGLLWGASACVLMLAGLCGISAAIKYRGRPAIVISRNAVLYYAYFVGRSAAFVKGMAGMLLPGIAASSARAAPRRNAARTPVQGDAGASEKR